MEVNGILQQKIIYNVIGKIYGGVETGKVCGCESVYLFVIALQLIFTGKILAVHWNRIK